MSSLAMLVEPPPQIVVPRGRVVRKIGLGLVESRPMLSPEERADREAAKVARREAHLAARKAREADRAKMKQRTTHKLLKLRAERVKAVMKALKEGPMKSPALHKLVGGDYHTLFRLLQQECDAGTIHRTGSRRNYVYHLGKAWSKA